MIKSSQKPTHSNGFTILEILVALALGGFLISGMLTIFTSTNAVYRVENGLARLQENARFTMTVIERDLRMTGHQYCTTKVNKSGAALRRPPRVYLNDVTAIVNGFPTSPDGNPYNLDTRFFIQGHECAGGCLPTLATSPFASNSPIPDAGDGTLDSRPSSADVLSIRYLEGDGQLLDASMANDTSPVSVLNPGVAPLNFAANDVAVIADCTGMDIFSIATAGNTLTHTLADGNLSMDISQAYQRNVDTRVFNLSQDFRVVSYYLQVVDNNGDNVSALFRAENGVAQELVRGVDRLDFRYGVQLANGNVAYLNADEIENNTLQCPTDPSALVGAPNLPGCLWSEIKSIEVTLLLNTVNDVSPSDDATFIYSPDSDIAQSPSSLEAATGVDAGNKLRREFRSVVSLRNYNS